MRAFCTASLILIALPLASAQETPKPSPEHELLAQNLGTRTGMMKMWTQPEAAPIEVPFKETSKSILNGFWVESEFESGPYKGRAMSGYDPKKKMYIGTWANNLGPHLALMEGTYDEQKHELTMTFKDYDAVSGQLTDHKSVTSNPPGKPETMTMYKKDAKGEWVTSFVMTYDKQEK